MKNSPLFLFNLMLCLCLCTSGACALAGEMECSIIVLRERDGDDWFGDCGCFNGTDISLYERIHEYVSDADFLVYFPTIDQTGMNSIRINQNIQGINENPVSNNYTFFDSRVILSTYGGYKFWTERDADPFYPKSVKQLMLHEISHYWLVNIKGLNANPDDINPGRHYDHNVDLFNGVDNLSDPNQHMSWKLGEDGTYFCDDVNEKVMELRFSDLSLYIMGLIGPDEVGPIYVHDYDYEAYDHYGGFAPGCFQEVTFTNTREVTIDDIIAANGLRIPSVAESQKVFSSQFVVVIPKDVEPVDGFLEFVEQHRQILPDAWFDATGGRSEMIVDGNMAICGDPYHSVCGNGIREGEEECDGSAPEHYTCSDECQLEYIPYCGDDIKNGDELCDGLDVGDKTCQYYGYISGYTICAPDCQSIDLSHCSHQEADICGNGIAEDGEDCDGSDLNGRVCQDFEHEGTPFVGTLKCHPVGTTDQCLFDFSECGICGDGVKNEGNGEECDGSDFGDLTCLDYGYDMGSLTCTSACTVYKYSCMAWCGNGVIATAFEECDKDNFNGETCTSLGYAGGTLSCDGCQFDTSGCIENYYCGNGIIEPGEECEGVNLAGTTCQSFGYAGGTLSCYAPGSSNECMFDKSECNNCGNNIKEDDEKCDGSDFGGLSCASYGYDAGSLMCSSDCSYLSPRNCYNYCGNGAIDAGEDCDGSNLNGQTCSSLGYRAGDLTCHEAVSSNECTFDISECEYCGDGVKNGMEYCDGSDFGYYTCQSYGYEAGDLLCTSSCRPNLGECYSVCGNNHAGAGEACDGSDLNGESCRSLGYDAGTLSCYPSWYWWNKCNFNTRGCYNYTSPSPSPSPSASPY